jgi:glycosyltransferase involved in cell wall biosynthesis
LVGVSPHVAEALARDYRIGRPEQWQVVPLGFDLSPFLAITDEQRAAARRGLELGTHDRAITIVGRLTAIKQHDLFLRVARDIRRTGRPVVFQIVGDGERRSELQALAESLGIGDAVRFLGWRRDLATVYAATDVCVLTSRNEGTPVALIEALAAGIPVVSTDVGGVKDVVTDAALGRLAPDGDVEMLARLAIEALADDALRADRVEARRASVVTRYGIDRLTADIAALYRSLVGT